MALQGELWRTQYGVATCLRCGSLGTVVEMKPFGLCCRIVELSAVYSAWEESQRRLSTNDSNEKQRTNEPFNFRRKQQ